MRVTKVKIVKNLFIVRPYWCRKGTHNKSMKKSVHKEDGCTSQCSWGEGVASFSTRYTGLFIALQTFNASKKVLSGYFSGFTSNQIKSNCILCE